MPEVGSDAWVEAFDRAVAGLDPGDAAVRVLHRIDGGPAWLVEVAGGAVRVYPDVDGVGAGGIDGAGAAGEPDLVFTWQRADAEAVAAGELAPLAAFQAGRLRIGGDLRRLADVAPLFARFPRVAIA